MNNTQRVENRHCAGAAAWINPSAYYSICKTGQQGVYLPVTLTPKRRGSAARLLDPLVSEKIGSPRDSTYIRLFLRIDRPCRESI
jgi:hypothetical protein